MSGDPRVRITGARRDGNGEDAVRRVLEAAAARPEEVPALAPFFAARVTAAARAAGARPPLLFIGSVAWHALPVLAALVVALSVWAGFETGRDADAQEDEALAVLQARAAGPDAPLSALLLARGGDQSPQGGAR